MKRVLCLLAVAKLLGVVARESLDATKTLDRIVGSLADALSSKFVKVGDSSEDSAARQRLEDEARRLSKQKRHGSKLAAELIRHLARHSLPKSQSEEFVSETTMMHDGQGKQHLIRHSKKCKNGLCEESTESNEPSKDAVTQQVDRLVDVFHDMEHPFSQRPFGRFRLFDNHDNDDDLMEDAFAFWPRFRHPQRLTQSAPNHDVFDEEPRATHSETQESVSTATVVQNGHEVTRTTRCHNGKCKTATIDKDLTGNEAVNEDDDKLAQKARKAIV
mmetsp:Transcript_88991/g.157579  ORF Transcript_88991/g.157579 Transcript_88991/m.157579 type:complete len:274 (-) Transcript_88991:154-975(-)|eukprot:CAMPEP_0197654244 /NCGR_PEP_ID=MMETSP1338-20131121/38736_1 /TAXON_ID=43686 ORGANISM="Pelagodinium beii, Strain RCC1491" /NCGR_SAMPLE_ID=MMETSP1338 /ASSEMBLY_ACC=CAM_ASM_000754 /LENGTH=273 /DNA_ID=CAMNT_0043229653 /DNA_START=100 /DNA_END=921 /DNA_ORIENTATION=+